MSNPSGSALLSLDAVSLTACCSVQGSEKEEEGEEKQGEEEEEDTKWELLRQRMEWLKTLEREDGAPLDHPLSKEALERPALALSPRKTTS